MAIPPGDRGEQLIANLILSSIAYQFDAVASAKAYAAQARAIAQGLSDRGLTYRPPRPSRFLRFACDLGGERESLLLSVIEGVLVAPTLLVTECAPDRIRTERSIDIVDFDIEQVKLRLRLRRLVDAMAPLERMTSPEQSASLLRSIVSDNLRHKINSTEPLDRAIDFLSLARDLVGKHNLPLATVCLEKAEATLNVPMAEMTPVQACGVQAVKAQIAQTIDELRRAAL